MFGVWLLILTPNENKEIKTKLKKIKTNQKPETLTLPSHTLPLNMFIYLINKCWPVTPVNLDTSSTLFLDTEHPQTPAQRGPSVLSKAPPLVLQTHLSPLPGTCPFPATGLGFLTGITAGSPGSKEAWRATPAASHPQNTSSTPTRKGRDKNPCA